MTTEKKLLAIPSNALSDLLAVEIRVMVIKGKKEYVL